MALCPILPHFQLSIPDHGRAFSNILSGPIGGAPSSKDTEVGRGGMAQSHHLSSWLMVIPWYGVKLPNLLGIIIMHGENSPWTNHYEGCSEMGFPQSHQLLAWILQVFLGLETTVPKLSGLHGRPWSQADDPGTRTDASGWSCASFAGPNNLWNPLDTTWMVLPFSISLWSLCV